MPVVALAVIWAFTPTLFWPMINELYAVACGRLVRSDAELVALVRRWVLFDWVRVAVIAVGFVGAVKAISWQLERG